MYLCKMQEAVSGVCSWPSIAFLGSQPVQSAIQGVQMTAQHIILFAVAAQVMQKLSRYNSNDAMIICCASASSIWI